MEFIKIPFGYLLNWLYQFTTNYGLALILFSLFVKLILLPMNIKSKKSMLKMSRLAPLTKALEEKYGDDKVKYQQAVSELYKEEGVSAGGGCLWSFLPLLILFPLYAVIRQPITYMLLIPAGIKSLGLVPAEVAAKFVELIGSVMELGSEHYQELMAASHVQEFLPQVAEFFPAMKDVVLESISFNFLGMNLAEIPVWKFWTWNDVIATAAETGRVLTKGQLLGAAVLPLLSGGSHYLATFINKKLDGSVATDSKGEQDQSAAASVNQSMNTMLYIMPLMSIWIGYSMPAAITVYWIAQSVFSLIIDTCLTLHFRKNYAMEDEERREKAAKLAAIQAEKEELRAARRAANPDGITENTSKKKQERKERQEKEEAARKFAAEQAGIDPDAVDAEKCPSGIPERPYCKGRNYDPNRYKK